MIKGVSGAEQQIIQARAGTTAGSETTGGDAFKVLLQQELTANAEYVAALSGGTGDVNMPPASTYAAMQSYLGVVPESQRRMEADALKRARTQYLSMTGEEKHLLGDAALERKKMENTAIAEVRASIIAGDPVEEPEEAKETQEAEEVKNGLASLFGENVSLAEALMMFCMALGSGGMGEEGGLNSGLTVMMGSLAKALSQKNRQEQEILRYDMLTDGYKKGGMDEAVDYASEMLFWATSEANYPARAGKPVVPEVWSSQDNRNPELYQEVIRQFDVENNPRYMPNKKGDGDTYCNIFLWDVTRAMGAEIPHYTDWETGAPLKYENADEAMHMNANRIYDWLAETGGRYGWQEVTPEEAQSYANAGSPAITIWKNTSGGHGHCQVVAPSEGEFNPETGVMIAQAGRRLYEYAPITKVYSKSLPDVKYYAHV